MGTCLISAGMCTCSLLIKKVNKEVRTPFSSRIIAVFAKFQIGYISVVAFLRVRWEPFGVQFGKASSSFSYHLGVLDHSVQVLQYNAIQDGNRAAEIERSGMICSKSLAV